MVNMFGNVAFLNEGEQAEEYKRKKAEEAAKKEKEKEDYMSRRGTGSRGMYSTRDKNGDYRITQTHGAGDRNNYTKDSVTDSTGAKLNVKSRSDEDINRKAAASEVVGRNFPKKDGESWFDKERVYNTSIAKDAINKDMRRHPDRWKEGPDGQMHRESSIFESVEFI